MVADLETGDEDDLCPYGIFSAQSGKLVERVDHQLAIVLVVGFEERIPKGSSGSELKLWNNMPGSLASTALSAVSARSTH
jgi:hypothetical protein